MKAIEIYEALNPLDYANELDKDVIVLTSNKKPIAALVSLKNADQESLALSTNPEFIKIIGTAREEFKADKKLSLEDNETRNFRINSRLTQANAADIVSRQLICNVTRANHRPGQATDCLSVPRG